jgi:hypothetical protein
MSAVNLTDRPQSIDSRFILEPTRKRIAGIGGDYPERTAPK